MRLQLVFRFHILVEREQRSRKERHLRTVDTHSKTRTKIRCVICRSSFLLILSVQVTFADCMTRKGRFLQALQSDYLVTFFFRRRENDLCIVDHCDDEDIKTCYLSIFILFFTFVYTRLQLWLNITKVTTTTLSAFSLHFLTNILSYRKT